MLKVIIYLYILNIVNALKALKTPQYLGTTIQDYLSNRVLIYDTYLGDM